VVTFFSAGFNFQFNNKTTVRTVGVKFAEFKTVEEEAWSIVAE